MRPAAAAALPAQPQPRRATTITALRSYPGFYHQQTVLVVGEVKGTVERATIGTEEGAIRLIARELPREGKIEARGQLLDIGRMSQDDPRLIPFNLLERVRAAYQDRWPKPGEELILILASTRPAAGRGERDRAAAARGGDGAGAIRRPEGHDRRTVPRPQPVRRSARGAASNGKSSSCCDRRDAAVWVMGLQPKGKDFNFDPGKRIDTGRWVKVQGTVRAAPRA